MASRPIDQPLSQAAEPTTILLADDDPAIRRLIEHYLRKAGYAVLVAEDGLQALEMLKVHRPALLLLDCQMPGMDGYTVCKWLRCEADFSETPVVFLTALSDMQSVVRGFEVGGVDYVRKPVVAEEFLARIRTHLELAAHRRALSRRAELLTSVTQEQMRRLDEVRTGQELLLTTPAAFPELKLAVRHQPAYVAGGDFYEVARLAEDQYALFIADVSGHDLSVPFITGALKALTASFLNEGLSPVESMIQLNAGLTRFLTDGRFVSACYIRYDRSQQTLDMVGAGHPYPLYQRQGGAPELVNAVGDVLGMFEIVRFTPVRMEIGPGDRLFLFTDGITEGYRDASGRRGRALYGEQRLSDSVLELAGRPIREVVDQTVKRLLGENDGIIDDDMVLMGVEF